MNKSRSKLPAGLDAKQSDVIIKPGRPLARVLPLQSGKPRSLRGSLLADDGIMEPVDTF